MQDGERPNVLLVICHDLGQRLGCYGVPNLQTPRIDELTASGLLFERYFATAPLCSPSRGTMMTGCFPHSTGLMGLVNYGWDMPDGVPVLPVLFARAGYETVLFGFQHEKTQARRMGYQRHVHEQRPFLCSTITPLLTEWLRSRQPDDPPFFASVGYWETHRPFTHERYRADDPAGVAVPGYLPDCPEVRQDLAALHGLVHAVDGSVGDILETLHQTGLDQQTLLIFTTDHGIALPRAKYTLYDAGIATALLMRWPGRLPAGRRFGELLSNLDLAPTILDLCDVTAPPSIQGTSFRRLLDGESTVLADTIYAEKTYDTGYDPRRALRTTRWKYIHNYTEGPAAPLLVDVVRSPSARVWAALPPVTRPEEELYDLASDLDERTNLAGNSCYDAVRRELGARLSSWQEATGDPLLRGPVPEPPLPPLPPGVAR